MQWMNSIVDWVSSSVGERILLGAIVPFVSIVISAIVASLIARGGIKRLLQARDREAKVAAVTSLVDAARQASTWNALSPQDQVVSDRAAASADIALRLMPITGSTAAADWAAHEIRQFKRASASYSVQFEGPLAEFRDRLLEWQNSPRRARKIFESDLSRWASESTKEDSDLQAQQDAWVAQQHSERFGAARTAKATAAEPTAAPAAAPAPVSAPTTAPPVAPAAVSPVPTSAPAAPSATPTVAAPAAAAPTVAAPSASAPEAVSRPTIVEPLRRPTAPEAHTPGSVEAPSDEVAYAPVAAAARVRPTGVE